MSDKLYLLTTSNGLKEEEEKNRFKEIMNKKNKKIQ